jgi:hypothetical protein
MKAPRVLNRVHSSVLSALTVATLAPGCGGGSVDPNRDSTMTILVPSSERMAMLVYSTSNLMFTQLFSGDCSTIRMRCLSSAACPNRD